MTENARRPGGKALHNVGSNGVLGLAVKVVGKGSRSNAGTLEGTFAEYLIEADGTGHDARTRIGNIHHFAQPLEDTVFTVTAVEGVEDDVVAASLEVFGKVFRYEFQYLCRVAFLLQCAGNGCTGTA